MDAAARDKSGRCGVEREVLAAPMQLKVFHFLKINPRLHHTSHPAPSMR